MPKTCQCDVFDKEMKEWRKCKNKPTSGSEFCKKHENGKCKRTSADALPAPIRKPETKTESKSKTNPIRNKTPVPIRSQKPEPISKIPEKKPSRPVLQEKKMSCHLLRISSNGWNSAISTPNQTQKKSGLCRKSLHRQSENYSATILAG